jgi:lipid-A-disaccharide synthase-like uncharacterized protein
MMANLSLWLFIGFSGQAVFTARFVVQWLASERKGDSVVPVSFWWLSLLGGFMLLAYAISKHDPVIILGQSLGVFVYSRNISLIWRNGRKLSREVSVSVVSTPA